MHAHPEDALTQMGMGLMLASLAAKRPQIGIQGLGCSGKRRRRPCAFLGCLTQIIMQIPGWSRPPSLFAAVAHPAMLCGRANAWTNRFATHAPEVLTVIKKLLLRQSCSIASSS